MCSRMRPAASFATFIASRLCGRAWRKLPGSGEAAVAVELTLDVFFVERVTALACCSFWIIAACF